MGGVDIRFSDLVEPSVRDHSKRARILIGLLESGSLTVSDGQFDWGGDLDYWGVYQVIDKFNRAICWDVCTLYFKIFTLFRYLF